MDDHLHALIRGVPFIFTKQVSDGDEELWETEMQGHALKVRCIDSAWTASRKELTSDPSPNFVSALISLDAKMYAPPTAEDFLKLENELKETVGAFVPLGQIRNKTTIAVLCDGDYYRLSNIACARIKKLGYDGEPENIARHHHVLHQVIRELGNLACHNEDGVGCRRIELQEIPSKMYLITRGEYDDHEEVYTEDDLVSVDS